MRRPFLAGRKATDINIRSGPQMREYDSIVSRIASDRPDSILDWGCGWGQITSMLEEVGLDVTAVDYRPDEIDQDGPHPLPRYPGLQAYLTSDPRKLPFADSSFAAVLSCGVLEHVVDPDASLEEIRRVLQPGGTFYVYKLPNRYSYLEAIAKRLGLYYHGAEPDDRTYTKRSALALLRAHGFDVRESRRMNMLPLTLPSRLSAVMSGAIWRANRLLSKIPGLNLLATNLEAVAIRAQ